MAESKDGGKSFWGDLSRKTGTWAGASTLVVAVAEMAEEWLGGVEAEPGWHHAVAVVMVAAIRAIVGLIQGKIGDPNKASFAKAETDPEE